MTLPQNIFYFDVLDRNNLIMKALAIFMCVLYFCKINDHFLTIFIFSIEGKVISVEETYFKQYLYVQMNNFIVKTRLFKEQKRYYNETLLFCCWERNNLGMKIPPYYNYFIKLFGGCRNYCYLSILYPIRKL